MDNLVSTDWLAAQLESGDLKLIDASAHPTDPARDATAEFTAAHILGAVFLDLASLKNPASPVPNAVPTEDQFARRMAALGVQRSDRVVLYDDSAVKTAARAWFIMRLHGMDNLALLDGGLAKWKAEGRALESGSPSPPRAAPFVADQGTPASVRSKTDMLVNLATGAEQVIDARDKGRFTGETADTVHGLPGGHIPGARNLFYRDLYRPDGTFHSTAELRALFEGAGVDLAQPIVTTCGSGVTASVLLFALHRLGIDDGALYDGSWSEWGADPATPKETGEPG